ncbi:VanW family protein [Streptomyces tirandamycinicus]|uniref:VanW family protein n=1 Tax=Streptomyces tirandamycinicus TaxID=2174846 RepID=UPI00226D689F|nr:VanW family protein [Streptomyces tirandamycinicus]MCY0982156.1 VanW family protein [Streptomyces tirandamycinicus]
MARGTRSSGNRRSVLTVAGGAAVLAAGGLYAAGLAAGDVPDGTRVRGVEIGGMSRPEAQRTLDRELPGTFAAPLTLRIGDRVEEAEPAALGLSVDTAATAGSAVSDSLDPVSVVGRLFSAENREIEPVIRVDEQKNRAAIARLAAAAERKVRDGAISFENGRAAAVTPVTGTSLVKNRAEDVLRDGYGRADRSPVVMPVKQTAPRTDRAETERAMNDFAVPAMSGPVTLTLDGRAVTIGPSALGRHLAMTPGAGGRLAPSLDAKGLLNDPEVSAQMREVAQSPRDAELGLDGDRVVVTRQARVGHQVDARDFGKAVLPLLTREGAARTGEIPAKVVQPEFTGESARSLGIKEKVSSFTVEFPTAPYRVTNIARAVERIDGSVVLPGKEWSFDRTVGERTKENGFVDGIMINDGQYVKSPGGGVSAVATTMFNAVFFAGVKPVEYGAHSFYIERYPEGREATVAWGTLDLRWLNDSGNAVYVKAESTDTSVTISFLGTRKYDEVRATKGPRTHVKEPGTRKGSGPECEAQTPLEGFDVTVGRHFVKDGREVGRENFTTHYTPRDEVVCAPEKPAPGKGAGEPKGAPEDADATEPQ